MNPRYTRLGLALLAIGLAVTPSVFADAYTDRIQFADGLYTREMYELAVKEYASILIDFSKGEQSDAATFRMAECLRLQGKTSEAGRIYSRVVVDYKQSPFRLRAAYRRARLYMTDGDFASAAAHFNVILIVNPPADLASASLYYLGEALLEMGDGDQADATFARVITEHANTMFYVYALIKRGDIYRDRWTTALNAKNGEAKRLADQALGFFKKALERPGSDRIAAEALFQMAEIYFHQHEFEQSAAYYRQLLTRFPADERSAAARMQAAWSACNAGLYAESSALAEAALLDSKTVNGQDEWLYIRANSERQLLQNRTSVKSYLELLTRFPKSRFVESARYEIAVAYFKMGKYADAIRHAERVRLTPELRTEVCWLLAEANAALDHGSQATQYYRMVMRDVPGTDRARDATYRLAHQLQKQKSYLEASTIYNALVADFPKDPLAPKALYASAFCLANANAHEAAARDWRRLVYEYPKHELVQDALYQKAMSEIQLMRRENAIASLSELLRQFPKGRFVPDAYYWKGMLLREQDQLAAAEREFRLAMQHASRDELRRESTFQLGLVLQKLGRNDEAADLLQQLLASPLIGKFPPTLLEWISTHYGEQKAYDKAAAAAKLLVETTEEPAWEQAGWVLLARAEIARGKDQEAEAAFKHALELKVNTRYAAEAALRLGDLSLTKGDAPAADEYFRMASKKTTEDDSGLAVRARAFFGLGRAAEIGNRDDDASRYYMSVAILYDHLELVPESLYRAALAFDRLKQFEDRNKAVLELTERYPQSEWVGKVDATWQN